MKFESSEIPAHAKLDQLSVPQILQIILALRDEGAQHVSIGGMSVMFHEKKVLQTSTDEVLENLDNPSEPLEPISPAVLEDRQMILKKQKEDLMYWSSSE